ncbi:MAG TPA: DUF4239 domain-containing protein [Rhodoglobus sp.]|nr:DUF4239 domain-containing protein [Rhodoglobus sp.]HOT34617.1 DUF4239 domain-containing protein [Rhodoglobus sp.]HOY81075.1 DUF4239 domain-containing protein [Rhodoglobus sp.]HPG75002.1 DUF4239 domain-containing protein [Rhodoglobus sp.]HPM51316.1 DUF4239 domain-containing protein [Rhodoglobus sp.]
MNFFFYDGPIWIALPTFVLLFLAFSWAILLAVRPWVKRVSANHEEWDRVLGYAMQSYGIFYGILLALIAVSVYENFQRVSGVVLDEASSLGTLYRAVSSYPPPVGPDLQEQLRLYTQNVISVDWPLQGRDIIPAEGNAQVDSIQSILFAYEPSTSGGQALHNQTVGLFFDFVEARRARLDETKLALPPLLWVLVAVGAALNALMLALVEARNLRVHLIMSGLIAVFVALLIFVTAAMDHPYSGFVSVPPEPFQNLLEQAMKP